jgi:hypothetical protein
LIGISTLERVSNQMTSTQKISNLFSALHDGSISAWAGDRHLLTLTIRCLYLAERIDPSFDHFYVEFYDVEELQLSTWPRQTELPSRILLTPQEIAEAELEILSPRIEEDGKLIVSCYQHDPDLDYSGANLTIHAASFRIFDQARNELTLEQLENIAEEYWEEWSKQ